MKQPCGSPKWPRLVVLLCGLPAGCTGLSSARPMPPAQPPRAAAPAPQDVQPAAYRAEALPCAPVAPPQAAPFEGAPELTADEVAREVLARNPSLAQMVAAWQVAAARYPQVTALDDPMLMGKIAPAAVGANPVRDDWYTVEVSQKLPFPGKLRLRGENALAEASAAGHEVDDMRLQLVESARAAFYEYYLAARTLEINAEDLVILKRLRKSAESQYTSGKSKTNQEILQADVEIGREEERRLALEQTRKVAVARINTLLHLPPDGPLPPPPRRLALAEALPDAQALRAAALARRPDLQALADRIRAEEVALGVAEKEFYPDFEVAAGYDAMWDTRSQRPEVNVRLNLPIYKVKRRAAVGAAQARIAQRRAELDRQTDQVNFQVQEAYEQVRQREQSVRLYEKTILPKAKDNRETAESAYEKGLIPFVNLLEAQRSEVMLRERFHEAVADYHRRRAALERAVGGPLSSAVPPGADSASQAPAP